MWYLKDINIWVDFILWCWPRKCICYYLSFPTREDVWDDQHVLNASLSMESLSHSPLKRTVLWACYPAKCIERTLPVINCNYYHLWETNKDVMCIITIFIIIITCTCTIASIYLEEQIMTKDEITISNGGHCQCLIIITLLTYVFLQHGNTINSWIFSSFSCRTCILEHLH